VNYYKNKIKKLEEENKKLQEQLENEEIKNTNNNQQQQQQQQQDLDSKSRTIRTESIEFDSIIQKQKEKEKEKEINKDIILSHIDAYGTTFQMEQLITKKSSSINMIAIQISIYFMYFISIICILLGHYLYSNE